MTWVLACAVTSAPLGVAASATGAIASTPADGSTPVESALKRCSQSGSVVIQAAVDADAQMACEGVERALQFLARMGIDPPPSTAMDIVEELPGELGGRAVGCYLRETKKILLLSYHTFEAGGEWFRVPVDRELYRSAAAHEMAHAVVGCHAEPTGLPVAAHEYVAYVAMFATMDPVLRERLLAKFPGTGFVNTLQINDINHIVNPNQFGVDAWRHYLRSTNKAAWLREIITGQVVQELPWEGP
ncbi:DUF6639 family protein [Hydrogenophaga sp.]|uniref:DUF6639 family protein n=1 Tax=Hydrogenophaga sp. TaxID=1904254 RepID=UPI00271D7E7B|nr:DUF6639 family protein [Hydrogenophaga sp.]MDO8903221.1 hypothetical protein [Hydrogenophaga sp.]